MNSWSRQYASFGKMDLPVREAHSFGSNTCTAHLWEVQVSIIELKRAQGIDSVYAPEMPDISPGIRMRG